MAHLLLRLGCHQCHLTNPQEQVFGKLQNCWQVENLLMFTKMYLIVHVDLGDTLLGNNSLEQGTKKKLNTVTVVVSPRSSCYCFNHHALQAHYCISLMLKSLMCKFIFTQPFIIIHVHTKPLQ